MSFFVERTEPLPCKSNNRVNIPCHQVSREFPIRIKCDCELHFFSRPEYAIQLSHPLAIASSPICWAILPVDPVIPVLIWRRTGLFLFFMRPSGGLSYNQILPPPLDIWRCFNQLIQQVNIFLGGMIAIIFTCNNSLVAFTRII